MAVRDIDEGNQKVSYLEDQALIQKDFGEKPRDMHINTVGNVSSWTTRAVDWYNSERRIIFAAKSEEERDNWIQYFKKYAIVKPALNMNFLNVDYQHSDD
jgi:hypothetical protein